MDNRDLSPLINKNRESKSEYMAARQKSKAISALENVWIIDDCTVLQMPLSERGENILPMFRKLRLDSNKTVS